MEFFHKELAEQIQAGQIVVFLWDTISHFEYLGLSLVAALPQEGRRLCLIFYLTWSGLNTVITPQAFQDVISFGGTLKRVINYMLEADNRLGPVCLIKVYITDIYMCMWLSVKDTPATAFLIPKKKSGGEQFLGFHLALPMVFRKSAPFFDRDSIRHGKHHCVCPIRRIDTPAQSRDQVLGPGWCGRPRIHGRRPLADTPTSPTTS